MSGHQPAGRDRPAAAHPALPAGCGTELAVTGPDGSAVALGICEHWAGEPGSLELTWGAARRFQLTPQISGADVAAALDELLARWRGHLASVPGAAGEDTAVVLTWPARDIDGVLPLLRHGLAPRAVIAPPRRAACPGRGAGGARRADPPAGPADRTRWSGSAWRRSGTTPTSAPSSSGGDAGGAAPRGGGAAGRPGSLGVAGQRDGAPFGLLYAERPEAAGWIAPMARAAPVAYLELMDLLPGERGRGVAAALVAQLHQVADESGVAVTLLQYEQVNPLSGPFWHQQGYRPLWTSWEARPASTLR